LAVAYDELPAIANTASIRVAQKLGERLAGTAQLLGREVIVYEIHQQGWQST